MKPRLDFRRAKNGPVLLTLFGADIQAGRFTAEAAFVALPVKRSVQMLADGLKVRVHPVKWSGFTAEKNKLSELTIEVL